VICTTEEVLTEYLNYFAAGGPHFRRMAALNIVGWGMMRAALGLSFIVRDLSDNKGLQRYASAAIAIIARLPTRPVASNLTLQQ
jgi:hypothetical protein